MKKEIPFSKFHGTANDFIIIDHTTEQYVAWSDNQLIKLMCDRRFGIGADGLMMIENGSKDIDFEMRYYNSDGQISSMCGNGGRCISLAAKMLGIVKSEAQFQFNGQIYHSTFLEDKNWVSLGMQDVRDVSKDEKAYVLDTGSPHYVSFYEDVSDMNVSVLGAEIRNNPTYKEKGINVNFCDFKNEILTVRTFERGVEDETFSCGTGIVASVIALCEKEARKDGIYSIPISTMGGNLLVKLTKKDGKYSDILLQGPAVKVFEGIWKL